MPVNRIHVDNMKIYLASCEGENFDEWLRDNIGYGNFKEWIGLFPLPYRSFSFDDAKYETLFLLKWG